MPDLKLRYPVGLLTNAAAKELLIQEAAQATAAALDCDGYGGTKAINLTGDQVDVFLLPYEPENVRLGAVVVVELAGYDYPDRMRNIEERLTELSKELEEALRGVANFDDLDGKKLVSLSFLAMQRGSWIG